MGISSSVPFSRTTSWHGALVTVRGIRSRSRFTVGSIFSASIMPEGIFGDASDSISPARSSSFETPSAMHTRFERAEQVDGDRHVEAGRPIEEQRRPSARRLRHAVGDRADLEVRADRLHDARQLAFLVERRDEFVQVSEHVLPSGVTIQARSSPMKRSTRRDHTYVVFVFFVVFVLRVTAIVVVQLSTRSPSCPRSPVQASVPGGRPRR